MTDCHDWFAEAAEAFVRYLVAHAGFEVFGQSEWGADLAIHDRLGRWTRCEVRSSTTALKASQVQQKSPAKLKNAAEIEAVVWLSAPATFNVLFIQLNERGERQTPALGASPVSYLYGTQLGLKDWLNNHAFWRKPPIGPVAPVAAIDGTTSISAGEHTSEL